MSSRELLKAVEEMRRTLRKLKITRNPKYLFDLLEATIILQEIRLNKSKHRRKHYGE
jgi:hypothetical protein